VVRSGFPVYGQTNSGVRLGGTQQFCEFTSKTDGSRIYAAVETLYTELPTLAASAYLFKPAYTPDKNPNKSPATVYCGELNGTDRFDGGFGGWVVEGQSSPIDMCILPDLSIIDSWGLFYHTNGVIRGADLTSCLRFKRQQNAPPPLFSDKEAFSQVGSADLTLGGGAQFWTYLTNTATNALFYWKVELQQGNWNGVMSSNSQATLQTQGLSGQFAVKVSVAGPLLPMKYLSVVPGGNPNITCSANCACMVGIVATPDGLVAHYWTTSDAMCNPD
jgi:hypothetical protein